VAEKKEGLALLLDVFGRGMRILIDKDQTLAKIKTLASSARRPTPPKPSEQEFLQVVDDFLYHTVWTAKHLRRGELWWTLTCLDSYLQELIKTMIEWYTHTTDNWKRDTWFRGRFLEEWAEPEVTQELSKAFAHYDEEDAKRALMASMTLFSRIARETAQRLGYNYPASAEKEMANWIEACLSDKERRS
jgi:aminoglycoside 6-adenylyltransferase